MATELLLRKPVNKDIESMYIMLKNSLSPYLMVNHSSSRNLQLIIDRNIVEAYVKRDVYLCLVAEINSEIAGWLAGSSKTEVLSEHGWLSVTLVMRRSSIENLFYFLDLQTQFHSFLIHFLIV